MNKTVLFITLIAIAFLVSFYKIEYWKGNFHSGDSWGYYTYLPATFLYDDLGDYSKCVEAIRKYNPQFEDPLNDPYGIYHRHPETGKNVVKYSCGVALALSPFFALSHGYALFVNGPADGYSPVYGVGLGLGMITWVCFGLYFLFRVLNRYFDRTVSGLTILALAFATNLYYNTVLNSLMSHALIFSLYCFLIYATDTYYRQPTLRRGLIIGLSAGAITLVRMNEVYCVLIPLLWGITDSGTWKARFRHFRVYWTHFVLAALVASLLFIPQVLYWKTFADAWVFNGYIGEKFDFRNAQIHKGLFGYNNGWLVWSPIMALSIPGIMVTWFRARAAFWSLILLLPLHIVVIYSWWCWNYINGFGSRPMEHMYPLLAFALAAFFSLFTGKWMGKALVGLIIAGAAALNIFQIYQTVNGMLITSAATKAYYWTIFGKTQNDHDILVARASNEMQPRNPAYISDYYLQDFEDTTSYRGATSAIRHQGNYSKLVDEQLIYFDTLDMDRLRDAKYVKISGACYFAAGTFNTPDVWRTPTLFVEFVDQAGKNVNSYQSGIYPFQFAGNPGFSVYSTGTADTWGPFYYYVKIPHKKAHHGTLGLWNGDKKPFYIDDLKIELYK